MSTLMRKQWRLSADQGNSCSTVDFDLEMSMWECYYCCSDESVRPNNHLMGNWSYSNLPGDGSLPVSQVYIKCESVTIYGGEQYRHHFSAS